MISLSFHLWIFFLIYFPLKLWWHWKCLYGFKWKAIRHYNSKAAFICILNICYRWNVVLGLAFYSYFISEMFPTLHTNVKREQYCLSISIKNYCKFSVHQNACSLFLFPATQFPLQSLCYHVSVAAYYICGMLQAHRIFIAFVGVINGSFLS